MDLESTTSALFKVRMTGGIADQIPPQYSRFRVKIALCGLDVAVDISQIVGQSSGEFGLPMLLQPSKHPQIGVEPAMSATRAVTKITAVSCACVYERIPVAFASSLYNLHCRTEVTKPEVCGARANWVKAIKRVTCISGLYLLDRRRRHYLHRQYPCLVVRTIISSIPNLFRTVVVFEILLNFQVTRPKRRDCHAPPEKPSH